MSNSSMPFDFSQFVPGFDFLKNLSQGAAKSGAASGSAIPGLSNWVAPTLSVEEVDKRIQELKTVQYWLEQNGHALKATIQALEVQKMTLSTLRGMNLRMEDLAQSFARNAGAAAQMGASMVGMPSKSDREIEGEIAEEAAGRGPHAGPASADPTPDSPSSPSSPSSPERPASSNDASTPAGNDAGPATGAASAGLVDPLQWWGALTQQFQQIAASALGDAAQLRMPEAARPADAQAGHPRTSKDAAASSKSAPRKKTPAPKAARNPTTSTGATAVRKKAGAASRGTASSPASGTAGRKPAGGGARTRR